MSDPFIAEVRIWALNFAPRGWAFCNGTLLPIAQNTALFALLGTTYGGDGRTTVALPNLQGRAPMGPRQGPGLTTRQLGQSFGTENETLTQNQMPVHNHTVSGSGDAANQRTPVGNVPARGGGRGTNLYSSSPTLTPMQTLPATGGGQSHTNLQPFLSLNFTIALVGLFPSRN
jgi:microcystin-dependent protein